MRALGCLALSFLAGCATMNKTPAATPRKEGTIRLELKDSPSVGTTEAGQAIYLGGFSGLRYLGSAPDGALRFLTLTDRGPNADEYDQGGETKRPFALPAYAPRLVFLRADLKARTLNVEKQILLHPNRARLFSGLPSTAGPGSESPVDLHGARLPNDAFGADPEGVGQAADGSFWVAEEYGPSLLHFSAEGSLLETLRPGNGLPAVLSQRRMNRGFEGLALHGSRAYAIMQSPLDNPRSEQEKNGKASLLVRLLEVDLKEKRTAAQYAYVLEGHDADKIGDIAVESPGTLLVVEHDGKAGPDAKKKVFRVTIKGASNLQLASAKLAGPGGKLELLSATELERAGVRPVKKEALLNLAEHGVDAEKVEGIDLAGDYLAVITDNDFGLAGPLDRQTGRLTLKDEKPALYLLPRKLGKAR